MFRLKHDAGARSVKGFYFTAKGIIDSIENILHAKKQNRRQAVVFCISGCTSASTTPGLCNVLNSYASGAEGHRVIVVRSGAMKHRIAMWASAGFLVAGFWALFTIAPFPPSTSDRMRDVWILVL